MKRMLFFALALCGLSGHLAAQEKNDKLAAPLDERLKAVEAELQELRIRLIKQEQFSQGWQAFNQRESQRLFGQLDYVQTSLTLVIMFFFGLFCALWAQNTGRRAWTWFVSGFLFSIFAVLFLLAKNAEDLREGREQRGGG